MLLNVSERANGDFSCFWTFQKHRMELFHASAHDRNTKWNFFMLLHTTETPNETFSCFCTRQKHQMKLFRASAHDRNTKWNFFMLLHMTELGNYLFSLVQNNRTIHDVIKKQANMQITTKYFILLVLLLSIFLVRCQTKVHNCKYSYLLCNIILLLSEILLLIEFCFIVSLIFLICSPCPKYTSLGVRLPNDSWNLLSL